MTSETSNSQCNQGSSLENDKCANYNSEANEKSAESSGPTAIHKNEFSDSGLEEVRKVTEKLKLNPRRPSIAKWMAENQNGGFRNRTKCLTADKEIHLNSLVNDKFSSVDDAIHWIKNELVQMRDLDHRLARQLIGLRSEINRLKLHKSCTEHQALLDDVTLELEERDEISDLCDIPFGQFTSPLRGIGITRMNLNARRFSLS